MELQIRIEIKGKDEFWGRAFHVEWESQFPDRALISDGGHYIANLVWLADLERVGRETFCKVTRVPDRAKHRPPHALAFHDMRSELFPQPVMTAFVEEVVVPIG